MSEIIQNLPFEEYAKRPGINPSLLKVVHSQSLMDAKKYIDEGMPETDAMDFGKCFHALGLEGRELFVEIPATYTNEDGDVKTWNWNAKVCKQWAKDQGDKIPLKADEIKSVRSMVAAASMTLRDFMKGESEVSMFAEIKGHPMKCRTDLFPSNAPGVIIDFKSCKSANPRKFTQQAIDKGYHLQGAINIDIARACGRKVDEFWLLAIESKPPHATCLMKLADDHLSLLRVGRIQYRAAIQRLIEAQEANRWPGYGTFNAEEYVPAWLKPELEQTA